MDPQKRTAQQIIESMLLVVGVTVALIAFTRPGGPLRSGVTEVVDTTVNQIYSDYEWVVAPWGACSVVCGGGTTNRAVWCEHDGAVVPDSECLGSGEAGPRPETSTVCNTEPCPVDGSWCEWGEWGVCSVPCDGGTRARTRVCECPPPSWDGTDCVGPSVDSEPCNVFPCWTTGWWTGVWTGCPDCGPVGTNSTRVVECRDMYFTGQPSVVVPDGNCGGGRPIDTQPCATLTECYEWIEGGWQVCSVACGGGTQIQTVECHHSVTGDLEPETRCLDAGLPKPPDVQDCNEDPCMCLALVPNANWCPDATTQPILPADNEQIYLVPFGGCNPGAKCEAECIDGAMVSGGACLICTWAEWNGPWTFGPFGGWAWKDDQYVCSCGVGGGCCTLPAPAVQHIDPSICPAGYQADATETSCCSADLQFCNHSILCSSVGPISGGGCLTVPAMPCP